MAFPMLPRRLSSNLERPVVSNCLDSAMNAFCAFQVIAHGYLRSARGFERFPFQIPFGLQGV